MMKWTPRDICVLILITGVLVILAAIAAFDFYLAMTAHKAPDGDVIHMVEKALIGAIGMVAGYFGAQIGAQDESQ